MDIVETPCGKMYVYMHAHICARACAREHTHTTTTTTAAATASKLEWEVSKSLDFIQPWICQSLDFIQPWIRQSLFETEFIAQFLKAGNLARCSWPKDLISQTLAVIRDLPWAMTLSCFSHNSDRGSMKSGSKLYKQLLKKSDILRKRRKTSKSVF